MAALQSIRKRGALLIGAIGLALFAFIAEEFFRSLETTSNMNKQQVGEVYGEKLSVQDYQQMVDEASELYKLQYGNLNDQMQDRVRDEVWNGFVNYKLVEHEANKLGLIVTDEEMQNALREGTAESLRRMGVLNSTGLAIVDQTGRFNVQVLQDFLKQYKDAKANPQANAAYMEAFETINKIWLFTEKELRKELLIMKYNTLLQQSFIANPVSAKMLFEDNVTKSEVELASIPFSSVEDKDVVVEDAELKAMYAKNKEQFATYEETRDLKYIDVEVTASFADRQALQTKMKDAYEKLVANEDPATVVAGHNSLVAYVNAPLSENAFRPEYRAILDSMAVGSVKVPFYNAGDNTFNLIKLVSKVQAPDSVQLTQLAVIGASAEEIKQRTDSVMNALAGGANFAELAKAYGQPTDTFWVTSAQYENSPMDESGAKYVTTINTTPANQVAKVEMLQGNLIVKVLNRKAITTKYNAAIVKNTIDFSKETYRKALNDFNRFISENRTMEAVDSNAIKSGYVLKTLKDFSASSHNVAGVAATKDAVRWIFDEAEVGNISKLYECGNGNNHLLLVMLTNVNEKGYRPWDNAEVKETLTTMVKAEKKAAFLMKQLAGVKDMAAAKTQKNVEVDTLKNISFSMNPYIASAGVPEAIVAGAVSKTEAGKFCGPVVGGEGVYMLQVLNKEKGSQEYNEAENIQMVVQRNFQAIGRQFGNVLGQKANIVDNRYKF